MTLEISLRQEDGAPAAIRIDGAMTIYEAKAGKDGLLRALDGGTAIDLDLSGVTEMDVAGVQLIVLLKREADARGTGLRVAVHSAATREALDRLGLGGHFE